MKSNGITFATEFSTNGLLGTPVAKMGRISSSYRVEMNAKVDLKSNATTLEITVRKGIFKAETMLTTDNVEDLKRWIEEHRKDIEQDMIKVKTALDSTTKDWK